MATIQPNLAGRNQRCHKIDVMFGMKLKDKMEQQVKQ